LRIAVVYDCLYPFSTGGGELQYRTFAEEFAAAGHQVTYVTRQQWDGAPPATEGFDIAVISTDREIYDETGTRTLPPAITFARGLYSHLRSHRGDYDAVLVSATPALNVPAARAGLRGTRTVLAVDWLEVWRPEQWREYSGPLVGRAASTVQRVAARLSRIATCHSQLNARRLADLAPRVDVLLTPGLIDGSITVEPSTTAAEPPSVVYVGRHIPDKRVEALPAAIAFAREKIPELTATIFGEGQTRAAVLAEIDRLGLGDVIATPGFVSRETLNEAVRSASCLVNPSAREGYGLVVVESCGAGTPVVLVAGEDNASVELIDEGVNGQVAASVAPEVLGAAIVEVVTAGKPLRESTLTWFETARKTRTLQETARTILDRIQNAG
jgi:glycosyltransferase involved in cell wall biosynthesis